MVQLFLDGGNFMIPILGVGIVGLIFVFERLYHLISGLGANESFALDVAETTSVILPIFAPSCAINSSPTEKISSANKSRSKSFRR